MSFFYVYETSHVRVYKKRNNEAVKLAKIRMAKPHITNAFFLRLKTITSIPIVPKEEQQQLNAATTDPRVTEIPL